MMYVCDMPNPSTRLQNCADKFRGKLLAFRVGQGYWYCIPW